MIEVYAILISEGKMQIENVPVQVRDAVAQRVAELQNTNII